MERTIKMKPGKYYIVYMPLQADPYDNSEFFNKTFENDHLLFLVGNYDYMEFDDRESWELYYQLIK